MRLSPTLPLLILAALPQVATAEPFDFLFGGQGTERAYRTRRRAPRLPPVPMPVPRPHFPSDDAAAAVAAAPKSEPPKDVPAPKLPAKPEEPPAPAQTAAEAPPAPLPPIKPPELAHPAAPPPAVPPNGDTDKVGKNPGSTETTPPTETAPAPSAAVEGTRPAEPPLPPVKPPEVARPPEAAKPTEATKPAVAPSGATNAFTPRQPDEDAACVDRIKARKVEAEPVDIGKQPDDRCTVVHPVKLTALTLPDGGKVEFPDRPTIACTTADTFSLFVRDLLVPLAKGTLGAPVSAVWTGPGLECRSRDHIFGAKLSAHGQGLAVDIAQIRLADGRRIAVGEPKDEADTAFETAARAAGCGYFHTALGPGTDEYHRTHWHFDLEVRGAKGDSKYCK